MRMHKYMGATVTRADLKVLHLVWIIWDGGLSLGLRGGVVEYVERVLGLYHRHLKEGTVILAEIKWIHLKLLYKMEDHELPDESLYHVIIYSTLAKSSA
jgi:hypothetical protein